MMKQIYAYDKKGEILSATECEKNETYFADYNLTVKLVKAEGEQRQLDLVIPLLNRLRTLRKKLNEQEEQRNITRIVP